jgi:dTDP-4-dehydrorhamnose reductase
MRILITGASGQLGFEFSEVLKGDIVKVYNTKEVQGGYKLDLTNYSAVEDSLLKRGRTL